MNILFVSLQYPWPAHTGGRQRRYHLIRELARQHRVTLAAIAPTFEIEEGGPSSALTDIVDRVILADPDVFPSEWQPQNRWLARCVNLGRLVGTTAPRKVQEWRDKKVLEFLDRLQREGPFDGVWLDRFCLGEAGRLAGLRRAVVDLDDLEHVQYGFRHAAGKLPCKPWYSRLELAKLRRFERSLPRRFWRVVVCKEEDRAFFPGPPDNVFVVPNGVADQPLGDPALERPEVLFIGTMNYDANVDAVTWFAAEALPALKALRPEATFEIAGRSPAERVLAMHAPGQVHIHVSPPDLTPHYDRAAVVVAPLRMGSGTKIKVLEALGRGKALVATAIGVEGLNLRPEIDYLHAATPAEMAAACARLLADPAERRRLGETGRERVRDQFHWQSVGRQAERVLLGA